MQRFSSSIIRGLLCVLVVLCSGSLEAQQSENASAVIHRGNRPQFYIIPFDQVPIHARLSQAEMARIIMLWIDQNPLAYQRILAQPALYAKITHEHFYAFRPDQRSVFRQLSESHKDLLEPQLKLQNEAKQVPVVQKQKKPQASTPVKVYLMPVVVYERWKKDLGI